MVLEKLYNLENGVMRIAGLMSGSGSNLRKIIEHGDLYFNDKPIPCGVRLRAT